MGKIKTIFFSTVTFLLPFFAYAQDGPLVDAADEYKELDQNQLIGIFLGIAQWFLVLVGIIAVIMVLVSAYKFVTGGNNEDQVQKAKSTLVWAIVGTAVAIVAFSIVTFTKSALEGPVNVPDPNFREIELDGPGLPDVNPPSLNP